MTVKVFGAPNCAGCKTVKRKLEEYELDNEVQNFDVNKIEGMDEAMKYGVMSIPTLIVIDGAGVHKYVGEKNCLEGIAAHLEV